jgi:hypothetical protein
MKLKLYLILLVFSSQFLSHAQTGKSLNFDGINDGVILGTSLNSQLDPINNFTVEIMVRPESNSGTRYIVGNYKTASPDELQFLLRQENSYYQFWINDGPGFKLVSSPINTLQLNTWQHVTGVWDGSEIRIYIDGVLQNTTTGVTGASFVYTTNPVHIGQNTNNSAFDGDLDEIRIWSTVRSQTTIQAEMNTELVGDEPGLLRYYNFNQGIANGDNTAITNLIDASSNTNNGTFSNFALTGTTSNFTGATNVSALSVPATHLNFDGVNDRVELPNESMYDFTTAMTVEVWMNSNVIPEQWDPLISKGDDSWRLHLNDNGTLVFSCNVGSSTSTDATSTTVITDGNWHHVAGTFDGTSLKLYIDGVLESQVAATGSINNSSFPVYIGNNSDYLVRFFNGNIDDVRIWNVARTAEQIIGSKNCELQGTESGLVSYFNFNQGIDSGNNTSVITAFCGLASNVGNLVGFDLTGNTSNWISGSPVITGSIIPSNATVTTPVVYNQGATASTLTATVGTNGTSLLWYTTATGGTGDITAPTPSTASAGSTSYWVSSTNANGCESARVEIVVTVNAVVTPPTTNWTTQVYTGDDKTLANLQVNGANIQWYDALTSGNLLTNTTSLVDETTYFASQTVTGNESGRIGVTVNKISENTQVLPSNSTVANLIVTPSSNTNAQWFTSTSGGTPLNSSTLLTNGTYYVEQVSQSASIATFVGTTSGNLDGDAATAQFRQPYDIAFDTSGNMFVADYINNLIRKVTPAGITSTFAGGTQGNADGNGTAAQFNKPSKLVFDNAGNLLVTDANNNRIRRITVSGDVTTIAGSTNGFNDGNGIAAQFSYPDGIAVNAAGEIFVSDQNNNRIRKIDASGNVTTFAGNGTGSSNDGSGTAATFNGPSGMDFDSNGNLILVEYNAGNVRKITPSGTVTTIASGFSSPADVATYDTNIVFVADSDNSAIKRIAQDGSIANFTYAGGTFGDVDGDIFTAQFGYVGGITFDNNNNLVFTDLGFNKIKRITAETSNRVPVTVDVTSLATPNFDISNSIKLFPNPATNVITIETNNLSNVVVEVYDLNGRLIINQNISQASNEVKLLQLESGVYLFKIKSKEGEMVKKVIKK